MKRGGLKKKIKKYKINKKNNNKGKMDRGREDWSLRVRERGEEGDHGARRGKVI